MTSDRLMLHLVATGDGADLSATLADAARGTGVTTLVRSPHCFIGAASPFAAGIEIGLGEQPHSVATALAGELCDALAGHIDRRRSVALIGTDVEFVAGHAAVRYQYLMRRRPELTHERFLAHYRTVHARFGIRTPNIEGYTQFHVDLDASAALAAATRFAGPVADSVSELHLRSVAHFLDGISSRPEVGVEARNDEEHFVDRANSDQFVNEILTRGT